MRFESKTTVYNVIARQFREHPGLLFFSFGLCGAPMTADFVALDHEPRSFAAFEERWRRPSLSEADLWVGFMLLRGALGHPIEFADLPRRLQQEATTPERSIETINAEDNSTRLWPHLADEVGRWPATWRGQIAALRAGVVGDQADRASR